MTFLVRLARYQLWSLRATWPPLVLCLSAIGLALLCLPHIPLGSLALAVGALLLVFDAAARLRQAEMVRAEIEHAGGLHGRALSVFRQARSPWCSRRAALAAAVSAGHGRQARSLMLKWGYRPWHIFPDNAFSGRSPFLQPAFWRSVIGLSQGRGRK